MGITYQHPELDPENSGDQSTPRKNWPRWIRGLATAAAMLCASYVAAIVIWASVPSIIPFVFGPSVRIVNHSNEQAFLYWDSDPREVSISLNPCRVYTSRDFDEGDLIIARNIRGALLLQERVEFDGDSDFEVVIEGNPDTFEEPDCVTWGD